MSKYKKNSTRLPTIQQEAPLLSSNHYLTLHRIKQITSWFPTWLPGQKRVFVCQLMENCSREQLELLATSLEPILHLDFSTSLGPHLQALHLDRAATFHVQRTLVQNVLNPLQSFHSWACLESLPLTSSDGNSWQMKYNSVQIPKKKPEVILPAVPLTHPHHQVNKSIEDIIALRKQRFGSIPDFASTANLLRNVQHKELLRSPTKNRQRTRSLGGALGDEYRQAESFKNQLAGLSKWMESWESSQRAYLLLEVVKICDKDLLSYFVQCLHQRLRETMGINCLSDDILLKIFSFLTPQALCRGAQTCKRWNRLTCHASLWKFQCLVLSTREGLGDLSKAVEMAFGYSLQEDNKVDWKKTYRDLSSVLSRLKAMILKNAKPDVLEKRPKVNPSNYRNSLSLAQMLLILRANSRDSGRPLTTQELLDSAPESPASCRRRQRQERLEAHLENERLESERLLSSKYSHRRPGDKTPDPGFLGGDVEMWLPKVEEPVQLVDFATDSRPFSPGLPYADGVECLVLSGGLASNLRPGRVQPIPRVSRLPQFQSIIHCLQCDQMKIMAGTANREILVMDIRTGRPVSTLTGHKGSVQCLQYDAYKIVSGSWDTTCIVWDVVHFQALTELRGHTGCVSCLQFNEDILVTGSHDKSIRVWSTRTWDCVTVIGNAHRAPVLCLQLNPWVIASGSADKTVRLWSPTSYQLLHSLPHVAPVCSLHLSNALLITASLAGDVLLWNVVTASKLLELIPAHGVVITSLSLVSNQLFGAGSNGTLYEWDICSGTVVRRLTGHSNRLTSVWAGNGKIVTASQDKTVCVWFSKKAVSKEITEGGTNEELSSFYSDLPIKVVTDKIGQQTNT